MKFLDYISNFPYKVPNLRTIPSCSKVALSRFSTTSTKLAAAIYSEETNNIIVEESENMKYNDYCNLYKAKPVFLTQWQRFSNFFKNKIDLSFSSMCLSS